METVLEAPYLLALQRQLAYPRAMVEKLRWEGTTDDLIRVASAGAVTFSVATPLVELLLFATHLTPSGHLLEAALATALYLPLYVRHVRYGLRGERPRHLTLTLGLMAAVIVGFSPVLGDGWFYAYSALVASVLVSVRPRYSFPVAAAILIGVGVWVGGVSSALGEHFYGVGIATGAVVVADRAAVVFVLVWLVGALRRVRWARSALARDAVEAERDRIDTSSTTRSAPSCRHS